DHRAGVYSLGAMLYKLPTFHAAYDGRNCCRVGADERSGRAGRVELAPSPLRRTKENNWSTWQVAEARPWGPECGGPGGQAGRMISPGSGGALVTDHLGKYGRRTSRPSHIFLSALLRRTALLDVALTRSTCGCLPA